MRVAIRSIVVIMAAVHSHCVCTDDWYPEEVFDLSITNTLYCNTLALRVEHGSATRLINNECAFRVRLQAARGGVSYIGGIPVRDLNLRRDKVIHLVYDGTTVGAYSFIDLFGRRATGSNDTLQVSISLKAFNRD